MGAGPEAGCDQHRVDADGEHDVSEGQGNDEHLHGAELPLAQLENQYDQQVENAAHNNCISNCSQNLISNAKQTNDEKINSNSRVFCLILLYPDISI